MTSAGKRLARSPVTNARTAIFLSNGPTGWLEFHVTSCGVVSHLTIATLEPGRSVRWRTRPSDARLGPDVGPAHGQFLAHLVRGPHHAQPSPNGPPPRQPRSKGPEGMNLFGGHWRSPRAAGRSCCRFGRGWAVGPAAASGRFQAVPSNAVLVVGTSTLVAVSRERFCDTGVARPSAGVKSGHLESGHPSPLARRPVRGQAVP